MKKLKKYLAIGFSAMMVVTAAGCSGSTTTSSDATGETTSVTSTESTTESTQDATKTDTTTDTSTSTSTATATDDSVVYGKVTAIDGTSITLALGDMPQGNGMKNGEAPADTSTQSNTSTTSTDTTTPPSDATKPDGTGAPSGDAQGTGQAPTGEKPSGEAPSGDGQAPDMSAMFEENGETKTITVEDESLIKIMSGSETTTGSLSDIAVDTILAIQYDDSDNITSITIQSAAK